MSTTAFRPDPNHPSFCQICGRAVASEADRFAGNAFHCGLCNEIKLASPASTGYGASGAGAPADAPPAGAAATGGPIPPFTPPPSSGGAPAAQPNPGLAALLGLIPGVGAMYNGQYAKGVVHLIVFAILVNLADSHDIFGLFVAGWVFYQAIEAYHTARARRDGTPLPNPFGLNDIGERFGFGKAWPSSQPATAPTSGTTTPPYQAPPPAANWGSPWESFRATAPAPPPTAYGTYGSTPYAPPVPPIPPFDPGVYTSVDPAFGAGGPLLASRNRFPAGAIWLIALGTLFLLNTSGIFHGFSFRLFLPLLFLGLGVWTFIHKMTETGFSLADDGTPAYRIRLFRAARGSVWLILLGVIFFLADFNILSWSRSWPLFLILAGVMTFLERSVYNSAGAGGYGYPPAPPPYPPAAAPAAAAETSIVPNDGKPTNLEGR